MVLLAVNPSVPLPVYEQIREQVARMVAAGTLSPGYRLPTIRQLAADLGLAKGTVARAYELLEADAVIETRGRHGSFVVEPRAVPQRDRTSALAQAADAMVIVARQLGAERAEVEHALDAAWRRF